jgi:ABC-type Zn uptake system ZnuABC Zn-binding protein ZnuA
MPNNRPIHPPNLDANITYGVVPPQPHIHRQMRTNENMLHNPRIDNNNNQQTLQIYPNNDYYASSKIDRKNGDVHPFGNPHIHLNPYNMLKIAFAIKEELVKLDKDNANFYNQNYDGF